MIKVHSSTSIIFVATCGHDINKPITITTHHDGEWTNNVLDGLARMPKVPAIKAARAIFDLGLAQAKSLIDQLHTGQRIPL